VVYSLLADPNPHRRAKELHVYYLALVAVLRGSVADIRSFKNRDPLAILRCLDIDPRSMISRDHITIDTKPHYKAYLVHVPYILSDNAEAPDQILDTLEMGLNSLICRVQGSALSNGTPIQDEISGCWCISRSAQ
jgi:hypothetical protein